MTEERVMNYSYIMNRSYLKKKLFYFKRYVLYSRYLFTSHTTIIIFKYNKILFHFLLRFVIELIVKYILYVTTSWLDILLQYNILFSVRRNINCLQNDLNLGTKTFKIQALGINNSSLEMCI